MSGPSRRSLKDLAEEAKKRAALLLVFAVGLSYLMTLTSSSVWFNFPFAIALIILFRYMLLDFDIRRKSTTSSGYSMVKKSEVQRDVTISKILAGRKENSDWRRKVNSPPVEAALEQFTRHLVAEWITDLWYSRITPDRDGPDELVRLLNNVLAELSVRVREVNLIDLLTRDIIGVICNSLELYQSCLVKIGKERFGELSTDKRDNELKFTLDSSRKLHPALVSPGAEHKVLQSLADELISIFFSSEDLKCSFFRYTARELLACAVIRPVLNLANPRFINERIESMALNFANKEVKGVPSSPEVPPLNPAGSMIPSTGELISSMDYSNPGVELMQYRHSQSNSNVNQKKLPHSRPISVTLHSEVPRTTMIFNGPGYVPSEVEWAQTVDTVAKRKNQTLAPEHLENMWTKGRNYRETDSTSHPVKRAIQKSPILNSAHAASSHTVRATEGQNCINEFREHAHSSEGSDNASDENCEPNSESSNGSEEDENGIITGLYSPGIRIWESKSNRNAGPSHIHHPLETSDAHTSKENRNNDGSQRKPKLSSRRKRSGVTEPKLQQWQENEWNPSLAGDNLYSKCTSNNTRFGNFNDYLEVESLGSAFSGTNLSSSSLLSCSESSHSSKYSSNNVLADSFLKLRCEVVGANIVKSGSGMFAVYSVAVKDANSNSWSIKRRFRHFEELHRRLKDFPEYTLSLPPKHFLSSGLEVPVVRERCKLFDVYLKKLLQIPAFSSSIEVWDFLSVDSQIYVFSDTLSIIQTLLVNSDEKLNDMGVKRKTAEDYGPNDFKMANDTDDEFERNFEESDIRKGTIQRNLRLHARRGNAALHQDSWSDPEISTQNDFSLSIKQDGSKSLLLEETGFQEDSSYLDTDGYSTTPTEWMPPNLSLSVFRLVDVVFQLQDGAWIRRQAFWVAKQILQLGMGDTFDDWLVEKILLLRKGSVVASVIQRIEQILWPDGIFMTKHPSRRATESVSGNSKSNDIREDAHSNKQQTEAKQCAKFVHELIVEKAPAALVSLVGRHEYERCAQDIYFFLQSPTCLKQLAFELLELLLQTAVPELKDAINKLHAEKDLLEDLD